MWYYLKLHIAWTQPLYMCVCHLMIKLMRGNVISFFGLELLVKSHFLEGIWINLHIYTNLKWGVLLPKFSRIIVVIYPFFISIFKPVGVLSSCKNNICVLPQSLKKLKRFTCNWLWPPFGFLLSAFDWAITFFFGVFCLCLESTYIFPRCLRTKAILVIRCLSLISLLRFNPNQFWRTTCA